MTMRRNKGFTLIETLVSVALLTISSGLFLRLFLAGNRINAVSYEKERAMDMAEEAVEIFKSCDLEEILEEREMGLTEIYGQTWNVEEETGAYIFTRSLEAAGETWMVEVKADYGVYQQRTETEEAVGTPSALAADLYEQPKISHIENSCNIVISPEDLSSGEDSSEEEEEISEQEEEAVKLLDVAVSSDNERIQVSVSEVSPGDLKEDGQKEADIQEEIFSEETDVAITKDGLENSIYIFLPETAVYEKIRISAGSRLDGSPYKVWIIVPESGISYPSLKEYLIVRGGGKVEIFSNIPRKPGEKPILTETEEPIKRLYRLEAAVIMGEDPKEELVRLVSTKRE